MGNSHNGHDADVLEPWRWLLLAQAATIRAIEGELSDKGLVSLAWYDVLLELNAAKDRRLRMSDLGDRVVLSRTRVSQIVGVARHGDNHQPAGR